MTLSVSRVFGKAQPGQFVMLRPAGRGFPFLGRPLGIYSLAEQAEGARIEVLYRAAGKGTKVISALCEGDRIEILGPLGNRFEHRPGMKTAILVAGGIGIAPLVFLAERLSLAALPERAEIDPLYRGKRFGGPPRDRPHENLRRRCAGQHRRRQCRLQGPGDGSSPARTWPLSTHRKRRSLSAAPIRC